jgi:hypothetical protein
MKERRHARRISTNLTARWSSPGSREEGKIIDLSAGGCFVLTASCIPADKLSLVTHVSNEEPILLDMELAGRALEVRAEVVYRIESIGFAASFRDLASQDEHELRSFIDQQEPESVMSRPFRRVGDDHQR